MSILPRDDLMPHWRLDGPAHAPALVLLNSIGTDLSLWDGVVAQLDDRYRILRLDARGHGRSGATDGDYDLDLLAADVIAVMDAAGLSSAAICGLSLGGMIAMTLARIRPERVTALVAACTSSRMDARAWSDRVSLVRTHGIAAIANLALDRFFSPTFRREQPASVDLVHRRLLAMDSRGYAGCAAAIRDMDLFDHLPQICAPALVIVGEQDVSTPLAGHGDHLLARLPNVAPAPIVLPAAHLACLETPQLFAAALDRFLSDLPLTNAEARP